MPTPKKKHTKSAKGQRRSQIKLKKKILTKCSTCYAVKLTHRLCPACRKY